MSNESDERTIPLYEEQVSVSKADVVTDHLRVSTTSEHTPVIIDETVERGDLHVERIAVERAVDAAPEPRQEGDTLIVSIVEERLVVEKRLVVVEELRITKTSTTQRITIPETVRTMRATVEHVAPQPVTGREIDG